MSFEEIRFNSEWHWTYKMSHWTIDILGRSVSKCCSTILYLRRIMSKTTGTDEQDRKTGDVVFLLHLFKVVEFINHLTSIYNCVWWSYDYIVCITLNWVRCVCWVWTWFCFTNISVRSRHSEFFLFETQRLP